MFNEKFSTPIHILDISVIKSNLKKLEYIKKATGCKILFAIKGFSNDSVISYIAKQIDGISASGLYEAKLGRTLTGKHIQTFSSSITSSEINLIIQNIDCIIFNSITQFEKYSPYVINSNCSCGIRINPEHSVVANFKVNPCHASSRFGIRKEDINKIDLSKVDGVLFHNMCESGVKELEETLKKIETNFSNVLYKIKWVNIGGGQLFTDESYDIEKAIFCLNSFRKKFNVELYMEPCTAIMYNSGIFVATITDIINNNINTAILDASAICHLPDIVNFPYKCEILNSFPPNEKEFTYRIAGSTCYSGDIFGDYSFESPLSIGQKIVFLDTAQYSIVKSTHFNGIPFPSIGILEPNSKFKILKNYDYEIYLKTI